MTRLDDKYATIKVIRYPLVDSYLAKSAKNGIVTSQLHRFASRCVRMQDFVYNVALVLVLHRVIQEYRTNVIWRNVRRFFQAYRTLYGGVPYGEWERRIRGRVAQLATSEILPGPCGPIYN